MPSAARRLMAPTPDTAMPTLLSPANDAGNVTTSPAPFANRCRRSAPYGQSSRRRTVRSDHLLPLGGGTPLNSSHSTSFKPSRHGFSMNPVPMVEYRSGIALPPLTPVVPPPALLVGGICEVTGKARRIGAKKCLVSAARTRPAVTAPAVPAPPDARCQAFGTPAASAP